MSQPQQAQQSNALGEAPRVIERRRPANQTYERCIDLEQNNVNRKPVFRLPRELAAVSSIPTALIHTFLTDEFIDGIVGTTNKYIEANIHIPKRYRPVGRADIFQFFAILYYLGVVRLSSTRDLWSTNMELPTHSLAVENGMSRRRFDYLWRNISFIAPDGSNSESDSEVSYDSEDEDVPLLQIRERLERNANGSEKKLWFEKIVPFVNQVRSVSVRLLQCPGFSLSIDEMMVRFRGRSVETHRMKNKPISEGYKLFAIVDSQTGYVCHFLPDGRSATHRDSDDEGCLNEFSSTTVLSKTAAMIKDLVQTVTSSHVKNGFRFVIALENYFILPKVMPMLRGMSIGCVGTARPKRGWPPSELTVETQSTFNDLFWCVDDMGTLVSRWIDNNVVLMVSTVHSPISRVSRMRKRPWQTATNKRHVQSVWGGATIREIKIPKIIDDYNHWMGV